MKITWLGQAGLLFENDKIKVIVDPYLSDTLGEVCEAKRRRMPIRPEYLGIAPDVILLTHAHADHTDPATLKYYLGEDRGEVTVLAARSAYEEAVKLGGGHNYVCMAPHSVWSLGSVTFYAVSAAHSDKHAVGFIIDDGEKTVHASRFYNKEKFLANKEKLLLQKRAKKELIAEAVKKMALAKDIHDRLEEYYIKATDFDIINDIGEKILSSVK
jgi:hypothetical protein